MAEIGIVIVTYNSEKEIGPCLDAAIATRARVVVVDNASTDSTHAQVEARGAALINNSSNRGFAAAVNQGCIFLNCDYILLLNPDAVIQSGLEALRECCDFPRSAGAGGLLLGTDGRPQIGFMVRELPSATNLVLEACLLNRIWPGNPVNRKYRKVAADYASRILVGQPAGAFFMIRRTVWKELGGFDEGFFPLWFEDVDFCRRATDRGYRFYYEPKAVARHTGGHSVSELSVEMRRIYWYGSLLRYSAKHFQAVAFRCVCFAVLLGSCFRSMPESVICRSKKPLLTYGRVALLALRAMFSGRDEVVLSGRR
jgi:N-acetylglucosaminyl-diphospho-decaprenol L-rhamnosyltransferase